ncbi:polysaccharide deacetylase family protein [Mangrovibacillus cuniculi]|uniref:Polysaccharide deacetylase family protein n=2 Tax=Mangrovibacillus cuniculi TaxID=2593652 RepID=A0A7S8CEE8_9BACI|nr:polysaccharide deacetylase family protein [Mangrovibacillus cuniculi]
MFPLVSNANVVLFSNGQKVSTDVQPIIKDGRVLVPVRAAIESLGVKVDWDNKTKTVRTTTPSLNTSFKVGEDFATVNNKRVQIDQTATITDGRVLVPIRFISETHGHFVDWDAKNKGVHIFNTQAAYFTYQETDPIDIPVLMYHILLEGQNDTISVDPDRFKEHMEAIKEAGYTTITDYDLVAHLKEHKPLPKNPILITFDDGYISNYTEAYPVLKELNMKATVYVIASRIFDQPQIYNGELEKFTWANAKEMEGTILIQGHTYDSHFKGESPNGKQRGMIASRVNLNGQLETQKQFEERVYKDFVKSKELIEDKMGYNVVGLTYPYGDYSETTIKMAKKAGYEVAYTVKSGVVNKLNSLPYELNRITADGSFTPEKLLKVIEDEMK